MEEKSLGCFAKFIIAFFVLIFVVVGVLTYHKISFDNKIKKELLFSVRKVKTYSDRDARYNITLLKICRAKQVHLATLGVVLSATRSFLYTLGFKTIHLNNEERKKIIKMATENLQAMSGKRFGSDVEKWEDWCETKKTNGN